MKGIQIQNTLNNFDSSISTQSKYKVMEEKGTTEDEMDGWHHRLDGHKLE